MNNSYLLVRAARGPLVLIALGILFAFDQANMIGFERTWPILFIVFGVLKLVERLIAPPVVPPPYYPPQGPPPTGGTWQPPTTGGLAS